MVYLTRVEHFNAAHKLHNPAWSAEKNFEVFGKCSNENWHGHNYELHITVKGNPQPDTGFVFNAKTLSTIVQKFIIDKVDHRNINLDVDFMAGKFATAENLCISFWNELAPEINAYGVTLHSVKLWETPRIYVEYFGQ